MAADEQAPAEPRRDEEPRRERLRRHAHRARLYAWSVVAIGVLALIVAFVVENSRSVKVSWVFGSSHSSLIWVILASALAGWLVGLATSAIFRRRTRRRV